MLVIFDWDGTLCDSIAKITLCMRLAADEIGAKDPGADGVRNIVGLGLSEAIRALYPEFEESDVDALATAYSKHFVAQDKEPSPFFAGVEETLAHLKEEGHIITVATGKSRRGLDRIFSTLGWSDFFHGSRCADETASKPNPKMLYELLEEFSVVPEEAVMVGDTEFDMEMAQRAGIARIGVSYGAHEPERLHAYDLEVCLDHFPDIKGWIR